MGKVYTRTGDRGDTRLFDSTPVRKDDARVETYGDVDELNATIGVAVAMIGDAEVREFLLDIQRQLLSLGAQLADPKWETRASAKGRLDPAWVGEFEARIDRYQWQLPVLQKFTCPGAGPAERCSTWPGPSAGAPNAASSAWLEPRTWPRESSST
jgi:cob(I)alamin adenosyltransferase